MPAPRMRTCSKLLNLNSPMNEQQRHGLRGHYHSLTEQKKLLDEKAATNPYLIDQTTFLFVADEIQAVDSKFPGMLPAFDRALQGTKRLEYVRLYLGSAIGLLRAETEAAESSPVTQHRDFRFISDPD